MRGLGAPRGTGGTEPRGNEGHASWRNTLCAAAPALPRSLTSRLSKLPEVASFEAICHREAGRSIRDDQPIEREHIDRPASKLRWQEAG